MPVDNATLSHLAAWMERHVHPEEYEATLTAILRLLMDDPGLACLGWQRVRDLAG